MSDSPFYLNEAVKVRRRRRRRRRMLAYAIPVFFLCVLTPLVPITLGRFEIGIISPTQASEASRSIAHLDPHQPSKGPTGFSPTFAQLALVDLPTDAPQQTAGGSPTPGLADGLPTGEVTEVPLATEASPTVSFDETAPPSTTPTPPPPPSPTPSPSATDTEVGGASGGSSSPEPFYTPTASPPSPSKPKNPAIVYFDLVVDHQRGRLYGSDRAGGNLDVISTDSLELIARIQVGKEPCGIDMSPDGDELAVAVSGSSAISFIDLNDLKVINRVTPSDTTGPNKPYDVIYGPTGRLYSVGNPGSSGFDYVHVFEGSANKKEIGRSLAIIRYNPRLAITADGNALFISESSVSPQQIYRFDVSADIPIAVAKGPLGAVRVNTLAVTPDGKKVFSSQGQVWSGDLKTQLASFNDAGLEIDYFDAKQLFMVSNASQITVLEAADATVVMRIPLTQTAGVARVDPINGYVYVSTASGIQVVGLSSK